MRSRRRRVERPIMMQETAKPGAVFGRDTPRVDGPLKVTGSAKYTSDFHVPGLLYAVPVGATIAAGPAIQATLKPGAAVLENVLR